MSLDKRKLTRDLIVFGSLVVICWALAIAIVLHVVAAVWELFRK